MNKKDNHTIVSDNLPKRIKEGHQFVFSRQDLSAREADMFELMIANRLPEDWKQDTEFDYRPLFKHFFTKKVS